MTFYPDHPENVCLDLFVIKNITWQAVRELFQDCYEENITKST